MNVIAIGGRVGQDPETKHAGNGTAICKFSVAVNDRKKVDGQWQDATTWFNCVAFGKRAEGLQKLLHKGMSVSLYGKLEVRDYERKDGSKGRAVEVLVNDLTPLGSRDSGQRQQQSGGYSGPPADDYGSDFGDDSIPF